LKATALVSFISITELTFTAKQMNQTTFQTVEIFTLTLVFYFCIAIVITLLMRAIERRAAQGLARRSR
jgi:polar amino acid transport system permease protein